VPLPVDEAGLHVRHGVHDELHQPAVNDAALLPGVVVGQEVPELALAVAAGGADVLVRVGAEVVGEDIQDLLELLPSSHVEPPVGEVVGRHDGEAAAASAAVVVDAVRRHLAEVRASGGSSAAAPRCP
jgi:hypothetical protein